MKRQRYSLQLRHIEKDIKLCCVHKLRWNFIFKNLVLPIFKPSNGSILKFKEPYQCIQRCLLNVEPNVIEIEVEPIEQLLVLLGLLCLLTARIIQKANLLN